MANETKEGIDVSIFKTISNELEHLTTTTTNSINNINNNSSEDEDDEKNTYELPIELMFRWTWKGHNNEYYPIKAQLIHYTDKIVLHQILPHPEFPSRFSGQYFARLSTSALYIKPTETNGYTSWYMRNKQGKYVTLNELRNATFRNPSSKVPKVTLAKRLMKDVLLRNPDFTQTVHPDIAIIKGTSGLSSRRRPVSRAIVATGPSIDSLTLSIPHIAKILIDYLVEVLPCNSQKILIDGQSLNAAVALLPESMQKLIATQSPFVVLGCLVLWYSIGLYSVVPCVTLSTDCLNLDVHFKMRLPIDKEVLSTAGWIQGFEKKQCIQLYSFRLSLDHLYIYHDKVLSKSVPISNLLDEIAFARHIDVLAVKTALFNDTPPVFHTIVNQL